MGALEERKRGEERKRKRDRERRRKEGGREIQRIMIGIQSTEQLGEERQVLTLRK